MTYEATRDRVETYFDTTATRTWERLTSDAPVSGIRATVRAGREQMRNLLIAQLPLDLSGARLLDAGCGTGALAVELAQRGADVVGIDISPRLIDIAQKRRPNHVVGSLTLKSGDMLDPALGRFDHIIAMDSLIYYAADDIGDILDNLSPRGECDIYRGAAHSATDGDVADGQTLSAQGSLPHHGSAYNLCDCCTHQWQNSRHQARHLWFLH